LVNELYESILYPTYTNLRLSDIWDEYRRCMETEVLGSAVRSWWEECGPREDIGDTSSLQFCVRVIVKKPELLFRIFAKGVPPQWKLCSDIHISSVKVLYTEKISSIVCLDVKQAFYGLISLKGDLLSEWSKICGILTSNGDFGSYDIPFRPDPKSKPEEDDGDDSTTDGDTTPREIEYDPRYQSAMEKHTERENARWVPETKGPL
jgi:hypothetical protein